MENENEEERTAFGSIGGADAAPTPPPPAASQGPSSPAWPASSTPVAPVPPAPTPPAAAPLAPTPPSPTPPAAAPLAPTPPQPAASSFNTVSPGANTGFGATAGAQSFQQPAYQPPEKKSKVGWIIGGVLVLLVVLGGAGIAVASFLGSGGDETETTSVDLEEMDAVVEELVGVDVDEEVDSETGDEVEDTDTDVDEDGVPLGTVTDPVAEEVELLTVADGFVEEMSGAISANGFDTFTIDLEPGDAVEVTVQATGSTGLDTLLRVVGPDGRQVAFNDDALTTASLSGARDSQLFFTAETAGTHVIEVLGYSAEMAGDYLLTVNRTGEEFDFGGGPIVADLDEGNFDLVGIEDEVVLTTAPNASEVLTGSIEDPLYFDVFEIELQAGESVRVAVEADPASLFDPILNVFDETFNTVGINDDAPSTSALGGTVNPDFEFVAPISGVYLIDVFSFDENVGDYTFTIERGEVVDLDAASELPDSPSNLAIASGETVTVDGNTETANLFDMILEAGDEVVITVNAADALAFDPVTNLTFGGWLVGLNDDANDPLTVNAVTDSQLTISTANSGVHTIFVEGYSGSAGSFTLTVTRN